MLDPLMQDLLLQDPLVVWCSVTDPDPDAANIYSNKTNKHDKSKSRQTNKSRHGQGRQTKQTTNTHIEHEKHWGI